MASELATRAFWSAAIERAIKSFAGTLLALLGTNLTSVTDVDWAQALGVSLLSGLASILLSVASEGSGNPGPSLANEKLSPRRPGTVTKTETLTEIPPAVTDTQTHQERIIVTETVTEKEVPPTE